MESNIIYIRTSTEDQEPKNQIDPCKKIINEDFIILEDKQSAFKDNKERDNFEKAKSLIKTRNIKNFIVWDLDRIYRNRIKLKEFFQFCKIYNCSIRSVNQQWLEELLKIPSPFDEIMHELMLSLMGWLAEDESKKKSDRVRSAIRKKGGITKSYKGNKWGRRSIPKKTAEEIIKLYKEEKKYREIAEEVYYWDKNNHKKFVSIGVVHKIIARFKEWETSQKDKILIKQ